MQRTSDIQESFYINTSSKYVSLNNVFHEKVLKGMEKKWHLKYFILVPKLITWGAPMGAQYDDEILCVRVCV